MAQTQVPAGSSLARKLYSVALFAQTIKKPSFSNQLTGDAPKQADAEAKLKQQTAPDMPFVRVTDLAKTAGDTVSVDMFGLTGGKPLMGDTMAEGRGEKMTYNSMDIALELSTKVVDAGGKMAQQRTVHNLRSLAMAQLVSYFTRLDDQLSLVHAAGARGFHTGADWVVPVQLSGADTTLDGIAVNAVKAPTYNRHFVASGANLVKGGQQLGSITTGDTLKLSHIDALRTLLDEMDFPLQPVRIADDPAAQDEPMWVMYVSPRQYSSLITDTTANGSIRAFQQYAWNRASYGSKHPLFKGEVGMWNGILVKKLARPVRFTSGSAAQIITSANAATATESNQSIAGAITSSYAVDRGILLGAQALATVYGKNKASDYHFSWYERNYNFERNFEVAGDSMCGKSKIRFGYDDGTGVITPTDHGVMVLDTTVVL
jgi:N4-gp56 family major capsid protein